jgi:hypothetical protein
MYDYGQMMNTQQMPVQQAQQEFLRHAALAEHYERLKMAHAGNDQAFYKYAELQYFHKSRAHHYKGQFSATAFMS